MKYAPDLVSQSPGAARQIIADRYELREMIGRGGMGCVWRAEHRTLRTPVAIKLLTPGDPDPEMLARFSREAQAAASLRGPNVVHILDHGVDDGVPYIAMEFLEGETLGSRLRRVKKLSPADTALVLTGVARGIARAHRAGIVHRDLKPDNIFLARDEESGLEIVKVLDFGIAKIVRDDSATEEGGASTNTGVMLGTPFYMSPEQARGRKEVDERADLWSLSVITYECLVGKRPFDATVFGDLMVQICAEPIRAPSEVGAVPEGFDAWFERAMQRDPAARFQSIRELVTGLAAILTPGQPWLDVRAEDPKSAPRPSSSPPTGAAQAALPASTTAGKAASRSVPPDERETKDGGARGRVQIAVIAAALAVAAGVGFVRGTAGPSTTGAAPSSTSAGTLAPVVAQAPAAAATTAAPPSASDPTAPTASASASAPPRAPASAGPAAAPMVGSKPAARRTPTPTPSATGAPTVNLGI